MPGLWRTAYYGLVAASVYLWGSDRDLRMSRSASFTSRWADFVRRLIIVLAATVMVAACATPPNQQASLGETAINDPLEGMNRHIFAFNDAVDTMLIRPAAYIYREATPRPIKGILSNFLGHLTLPLTIVHDLLQGKPERAQVAFGRLFINTVVGVGGLFDIATPAGFPMHKEDMGQTLAVNGVGSGPYLVLPILGPSSFRDGVGTVIDAFADPMTIASYGITSGFNLRIGRAVANGIVEREKLIEPLDTLRESLDYYATIRSAYGQRRDSDIRDGAPRPTNSNADPFASFDDSEQKKEGKPSN